MSRPTTPTVDADGHVLEPRDTWLRYIDPAFRDRAIRIDIDERGDEVLLIDGKPLEAIRGRLAALGGIEGDPATLLQRGLRYEDGCPPGSYDPTARLRVMDGEGIDIALLYPTIGICWEGAVADPALALAYTRAYNRWIVDFCSENPERLVPIAHLSLLDPAAAVDEATRCREAGCRGIYLSPDMPSRGGAFFDDPRFDRFWAAVQDLEMPLAFHVVVRDAPSFRHWFPPFGQGTQRFGLFNFAFLAIDVMAAFTQLLSLGVLERFPRLRLAVLEAGANWISAWLDRLDHKYQVVASQTQIAMEPSAYFYRQCLISADPDESMTADVVRRIGADHFVWASDYPHIDASLGVVKEMRERLAPLPPEDQRKVLGANAARFYGLSWRT